MSDFHSKIDNSHALATAIVCISLKSQVEYALIFLDGSPPAKLQKLLASYQPLQPNLFEGRIYDERIRLIYI